MQIPPPSDEKARLTALADLEILDTATEVIFDFITKIATELCDMPISLIVFIDKDRQWFKSTYGVPEALKHLKETPREIAFCEHAIRQKELFEVKDLQNDERFNKNPLVKEFPNIRFYAGMPLETSEGLNVGTICLLDQKPRELSDQQKTTLKYLSKIIMTLLETKKNISQITLFGQALHSSFNEIYLFNLSNFECVYANQGAISAFSKAELQDIKYTISEKFVSHTRKEFQELLAPLLAREKKHIVMEALAKRITGDEYPVELKIQVSFAKTKPILIVVANDITQRKLAQNNLEQLNKALENLIYTQTADLEKSLGLLHATLQSTSDAIIIVDNENTIRSFNQKTYELFGKDILLLNHKLEGILEAHLTSTEILDLRLQAIPLQPDKKTMDELTLKNGKIFECYSQPQMIKGVIQGRVWCFRDITTQKILQQQLMRKSTYDSVTDLPNRVLLEDRIGQAIQYAKEDKAIFAVLYLNINRFKTINDMFGHKIGNDVLKQIANRLKEYLHASDSVAHLGSDEFVILLNSTQHIEEIANFSKNLLLLLSKEFLVTNEIIKITTSIGISIYPKNGMDVMTLLRNADVAMNRSKKSLRSEFQFYTEEMNTQVMKQLEMENYLKNAIENDEIQLNYQPILDVATNSIVAVEALIRWENPKLGSVSPIEFIPLAETLGLILPIGQWVLRTACSQLYRWHCQGYHLRMAINVSAHQFIQTDFVHTLTTILSDTKVDPTYIDIELTESMMIANVKELSRKMFDITQLGITLVVDDFGTGYSNLSYLKNFPIGKLKIDRSFISSLRHNSKDVAIIKAIVAMAKILKFKVLAEGVENQLQFSILKEIGCDELQGYIFSEALNTAACTLFLKKNLVK